MATIILPVDFFYSKVHLEALRLQMAAQSSQSLISGCSQNPGSVESYTNTENRCDGEEAWRNKGVGRCRGEN